MILKNERVLDKLYRPEFMEMDGTYDNNIEISLTFSYGAESKSLCHVNEYNRDDPAVEVNALIVSMTA